MWSVDVRQQLNAVSGFWGLVLILTLWSCSRQKGLNASLQLLHTSCSPHVFHSSQTQARQPHTPTLRHKRSRRRNEDHIQQSSSRRSRNLCSSQTTALSSRLWSFSRPTLTSSLTSASMMEGTATSLLACLGRMTKAPTRIGAPWWACVGVCLEVLELGWQEQRKKPLRPACHLIPNPTARASAFPGPVSFAKGRRLPWTAGERPQWERRGVWRRWMRPLMLWRGALWWTQTRGCPRLRSCGVPSSISKGCRHWCRPSTNRKLRLDSRDCTSEPARPNPEWVGQRSDDWQNWPKRHLEWTDGEPM